MTEQELFNTLERWLTQKEPVADDEAATFLETLDKPTLAKALGYTIGYFRGYRAALQEALDRTN